MKSRHRRRRVQIIAQRRKEGRVHRVIGRLGIANGAIEPVEDIARLGKRGVGQRHRCPVMRRQQSGPHRLAAMLGNGLMVGLAAYMISLIGNFSAASGAKHGAVAGLAANGMLSVFTYAFYTCGGAHIFEMNEMLMDIVANMVFMGLAGAVMGILYQRNAAKS